MDVTLKRRLWAVLFPERCACCGRVIPPGEGICAKCDGEVPRIGVPVCPYCGLEKEWCHCDKRRRAFRRVVAPFYYDGVISRGILRFKDGGDRLSGRFFAAHMADTARQYYSEIPFDGVVCVPATKKGERARGFNPGGLLAAGVAAELNLPLCPVLQKLTDTPPQKSLPAAQRSGNVLGVFDLTAEADVTDKTYLLVDDVATTGSTLEECAKMLKIYGAREVYALTAALARL